MEKAGRQEGFEVFPMKNYCCTSGVCSLEGFTDMMFLSEAILANERGAGGALL